MSFNPILQSHWIYKEYFENIEWADDQTEHKSDDLTILKTTYKDNQFLTPGDIADLENETDEYYYNVYTLGNWGVLGNVVFTNWRVEDLSQIKDQFTNRRNGLDFGFSADPAAVIRTHYDRKKKTIYIFDELYETGLTNDKLAELVKPMIEEDMVVCDSSEPKSIAELQMYGVRAAGAIKGKDSVSHGIQWLKQHTIIIDKSCINAREEFSKYCWKEDRAGEALDQPLDRDNHLIDALRYAYEADARASWVL
jgi:phage terminase large subunit